MSLVVKNPLANVEELRESGSVPGLGRFCGGGNGPPLQNSCLKNPMDRGACPCGHMWSQRIRHA